MFASDEMKSAFYIYIMQSSCLLVLSGLLAGAHSVSWECISIQSNKYNPSFSTQGVCACHVCDVSNLLLQLCILEIIVLTGSLFIVEPSGLPLYFPLR